METVEQIYKRSGGNLSADTFKNNTELEVVAVYVDIFHDSPETIQFDYREVKQKVIDAIVTKTPIKPVEREPGELS